MPETAKDFNREAVSVRCNRFVMRSVICQQCARNWHLLTLNDRGGFLCGKAPEIACAAESDDAHSDHDCQAFGFGIITNELST
jgi:hypothetical protein